MNISTISTNWEYLGNEFWRSGAGSNVKNMNTCSARHCKQICDPRRPSQNNKTVRLETHWRLVVRHSSKYSSLVSLLLLAATHITPLIRPKSMTGRPGEIIMWRSNAQMYSGRMSHSQKHSAETMTGSGVPELKEETQVMHWEKVN